MSKLQHKIVARHHCILVTVSKVAGAESSRNKVDPAVVHIPYFYSISIGSLPWI